MTRFRVNIVKIRPSGHTINAYKAEFGCENAGHHLQDIISFLEQLETTCPTCMKIPTQLHLFKYQKEAEDDRRCPECGNSDIYPTHNVADERVYNCDECDTQIPWAFFHKPGVTPGSPKDGE